jgi:hypothetical protein
MNLDKAGKQVFQFHRLTRTGDGFIVLRKMYENGNDDFTAYTLLNHTDQ